MAKDGRHKNRRPSVPVATDSGKNSTSNPNIESLEWVTCKQEEELDKFIRKKLDHLYGQALSMLVYMGYHEDVALQGLLERGYCVGERDSLTNVLQNSLQFLTGKVVESEEQDRPQPFKNLELLVDFNLHFLVYILQKYSPNLNRMSLLRCILMTDLNLNLAITMNMPFDMPSDLNLDDDNGDDGEKDVFLALEIREMLDNLNVVDESVVSEDMKDAMIAGLQKPMDDLMVQVKERIRWASKKVVEARRKQPSTIMSLLEELRLFECSLESMLARRNSELLSTNNGVVNAEKTLDRFEMVKEEIKAEISASKLIESEAEQKLLEEVSKKKNWERQKVKLQEELELEKKKISKWEQQLVEIEAAIIQGVAKMCEAINAKKMFIRLIYLENQVALEKWNCWKLKVDALKIQTNGESDIFNEQMKRLSKLLKDAISFVLYK